MASPAPPSAGPPALSNTKILDVIVSYLPRRSLISCHTVSTTFYLAARPAMFKTTLHISDKAPWPQFYDLDAEGPFGGRGHRPVFRKSWLASTRMLEVTVRLKQQHSQYYVRVEHLVPPEAMPALDVLRVNLESPDWDFYRYHYPMRPYPWAAVAHLRPRTVVIRGCNVMHQELPPDLRAMITEATALVFVSGPSTERVWNLFKSLSPSPNLSKLTFVMLSNRANRLLGWGKVHENDHWAADQARQRAANRLAGDIARFATFQCRRGGNADLSLNIVRFNPITREAFRDAISGHSTSLVPMLDVTTGATTSADHQSSGTSAPPSSTVATAAGTTASTSATASTSSQGTTNGSVFGPHMPDRWIDIVPDRWIDLVAQHLPRVIGEFAQSQTLLSPQGWRDREQRKTNFRYLDTLTFLTSDDKGWKNALDLDELAPWHDLMDEEDRVDAAERKKFDESLKIIREENEKYRADQRRKRMDTFQGQVEALLDEMVANKAKANGSTSGTENAPPPPKKRRR